MRTWQLVGGMVLALAAEGTAARAQVCVDVRIGSQPYYDCLNQALANSVPRERSSAATAAPYSAASPPNAIGGFNQSAVREQLGSSFGHSVTPQRPAPPVYSLPGR